MRTISLQIENDDYLLIEKYAKEKNVNVSDLIRQTIIEKIEDELDLTVYNTCLWYPTPKNSDSLINTNDIV